MLEEKESSFPSKAHQRVYTGLTRNRDVAHKLAHTLSHLKAIQQTHDDRHESVLIVEDNAVMDSTFLQNWKAYSQITPVDWSVLQWTTINIAVNEKESYRSNRFLGIMVWISLVYFRIFNPKRWNESDPHSIFKLLE